MPDFEEVTTTSEFEPDERRERRSYRTLGTVLALIVVVIIVLLLWRSCDSQGGTRQSTGGGAFIERIENLPVDSEGVAIWVRSGASVEQVLQRNGLSGAPFTDFGKGTYVIEVGGDVEAIVSRLKADPGLHDAGHVYNDTGQ
ncbi:MAG: hypothetical protein U1E29_03340 [Coriobacteriia bacterium]|nr:hypothetical protein [Coriobacteriia bacterium]